MYYIHIRTYMHIKFHVHIYTTRPFQSSSASRDESTMKSTNPTCRQSSEKFYEYICAYIYYIYIYISYIYIYIYI